MAPPQNAFIAEKHVPCPSAVVPRMFVLVLSEAVLGIVIGSSLVSGE